MKSVVSKRKHVERRHRKGTYLHYAVCVDLTDGSSVLVSDYSRHLVYRELSVVLTVRELMHKGW